MSSSLIRTWIFLTAHTPKTNVIHRGGHLTKLSIDLAARIRSWIARSRQRQALSELAERNDYILKDIGVTPNEARREAEKWFWQQ